MALHVTAGALKLPLLTDTVNPKLVLPPAGRFPLPLGRIVITFPLASQDGVPFQVAVIR